MKVILITIIIITNLDKNNSTYNKEPVSYKTNLLTKNKFPLPYTGTEYPMIDGGGVTSCGREGIYADNKPYITSYNDFEK